ncbi:MAG: hypothetical protein R2787_07000 [Saprospiraceae bacterium]
MGRNTIQQGDSSHCILADSSSRRVGRCARITEDLVNAMTVLGACGIAHALHLVRAMQQGGIEIRQERFLPDLNSHFQATLLA